MQPGAPGGEAKTLGLKCAAAPNAPTHSRTHAQSASLSASFERQSGARLREMGGTPGLAGLAWLAWLVESAAGKSLYRLVKP